MGNSGKQGADAGTGRERRRYERHPVPGVSASSPSIRFSVVELSAFGMSIEIDQPLSVGEIYQLRIHHGRIPFEAKGIVKWCRMHKRSSSETATSECVYRAGFALQATDQGGLLEGDVELHHLSSKESNRNAPENLDPEADLEAARQIIEDELLSVVYQPIFDLTAGSVYAYEALARCPSNHFSSLPELFRAAAHLGRVGELGRLHRKQAVSLAPPTRLFINVSPYEFDHGWLIRPDDALFAHRGQIVLEITESVPVSRFLQFQNVLTELRKKGVEVAIDDLGAGFSNLKYLADLAPEFVKIDRALITGVKITSRSYALLEAVVAMCKRLKATVIAEGVETRDELVAVNQAGIDLCQGYLLGRPTLPASEDSWPAFM